MIFFYPSPATFVVNIKYEEMRGNTKITIQGHLDKSWMQSFEGMKISYEGDNTILSGIIKDEAHLHGILGIIRDLNLNLISINPLENNPENKVL